MLSDSIDLFALFGVYAGIILSVPKLFLMNRAIDAYRRKFRLAQNVRNVAKFCVFPKQVYLWGSILEKERLDTLVGALCCVGRGFGRAGRAAPGWAWDLAVLGALGWVGRGVWLWWWVGHGFGFLCMVYIVRYMSFHVFMMVIWFNWFICTVWGLCWCHSNDSSVLRIEK